MAAVAVSIPVRKRHSLKWETGKLIKEIILKSMDRRGKRTRAGGVPWVGDTEGHHHLRFEVR
jgi:hypothetical protein